MIRVIVADDQRLMREGLATILGIEPDIEVIGTVSDGQEAYQLAQSQHPDVVLMDIRMPGTDGVTGTKLILDFNPSIRILILTTFNDTELIFNALELGASGYLLKDMPSETIVSAVRTVYNGGTVLQPDITAQILTELKKIQANKQTLDAGSEWHSVNGLNQTLTDRERDVLVLLGNGMNNKEIAEALFISEGTVKNHVSNLISKLGLRDRTQAAVFAVKYRVGEWEA